MNNIKLNIVKTSILISTILSFGWLIPNYALAQDNSCGVETSIIKCKDGSNPVASLLKMAVNILYAVVGILAVVMFVVAGIIYATAGEQADKVSLAKTIMKNTTIGILLYVFLTIILNFLVPGGVF